MKTAIAVLLSFFCLTGTMRGEFEGFLMGSEERVMEHCLTNVQGLSLYVYQPQYLGEIGKFFGNTPALKSKEELDKFFKIKLDACAQGALTNSSAGINKDAPFLIWAAADHWDADFRDFVLYFGVTNEFKLIKNSDGSYRVPDLSHVVLKQTTKVWYKVPALKWARIETFSDEEGNLEVRPDWVNLNRGYLIIDRDVAIAGVNQINLVSGNEKTFQVFDGTGKQIPERLPKLNILSHKESLAESKRTVKVSSLSSVPAVTVNVVGGEIGRVLKIQSSSSITGPWKDVDGSKHSVWTYDEYEGGFTHFDETMEENEFYRLVPLNEVPSS